MVVEHKGYMLQQNDYNHHYMIIDVEKNELCCHASCTVKLTEEEAKEHIESFIRLKDILF